MSFLHPIPSETEEENWRELERKLADDLVHILGNTGEPALQSGVTNYLNAAFFKDPFGMVHFRGEIQIPNAGLPANTLLFTLPVGYQPTVRCYIPVKGNVTAGTYIGLKIDTAGQVFVDDNGPAWPAGTPSVINLANVHFSTR